MDMPPATQGRRAFAVVDRNLDELCACLDDALSSRQRSPYAEKRLRDKIKAKTDFLRPLLAAEAECHGGARPVHLAEAEARFAVLEATFDQWVQRAVVAAPEPAEEEEVADCSGSSGSSGSACSCTDSCQEATEADATREDVVEAPNEEGASDVIAEDNDDAECESADTRREQATDSVAKKQEATGTRQEATEGDAKRDAVETRIEEGASDSDVIAEDNDAECETAETRREEATDTVAKKREAMGTHEEVTLDAIAKKRHTDREAEAETGRRAVQRRWWRQSAAWCGAAGVVAVVAVGLAVELASVAHHNVNVYVVPT